MPKLPFMKLYPADLLMDCQTLTIQEFGAWVKLIMLIWHKSETGTLDLSYRDLTTVWGVDLTVAQKLLKDLHQRDFFDMENMPDEVFRVTCRRIEKDKKELIMNALYQRRHRKRVRPLSGSSKAKVSDKKSEVRSQINTPIAPKATDERFAAFWAAYPRKVGKGAAEKSWRNIRPDADLATRIVQAVEAQKSLEQWQRDGGQFIPHPATWLNQKRWEDEVPKGGRSGIPARTVYDKILGHHPDPSKVPPVS